MTQLNGPPGPQRSAGKPDGGAGRGPYLQLYRTDTEALLAQKKINRPPADSAVAET